MTTNALSADACTLFGVAEESLSQLLARIAQGFYCTFTYTLA